MKSLTALLFSPSADGLAFCVRQGWDSEFPELTGLPGDKPEKNLALDDKAIIQFVEEERERLAERMPKKRVGICEDETFFLSNGFRDFFFRRVASKSKDKEQKKRLEARYSRLLSSLRSRCGLEKKPGCEELGRLEKPAL